MGRTVLVSGTASGIGLACASLLLQHGFEVRGIDLLDCPDEFRDEPAYRHVVGDVSSPETVSAWITETTGATGDLDGLVNCAGVHPPPRRLEDCTLATFEELWRVNVVSAFWACKEALPFLRRKRGSIVTVSSLVARIGQSAAVEYCATKGALDSMTRALAIDEAPHGVRVNAVCPGAILTPLARRLNSQEELETMARSSWIARLGESREVAEVVVFLLTAATFVTGECIAVSGGAELGYGAKPSGD